MQDFPNIADLLRRKGIWLDKRKSQHFLKRQEVCSQIADLAELAEQDLAIEVGAGLGNLSVELAARAGRVVSVELDQAFADWHGYLQASYPRLEFLYQDFLHVDLEQLVAEKKLSGRIFGIGNLPYQITSEILFKFVDSPQTFDALVFMVQKEFAERVCAGPAAREAGALTYKVALRYEAVIELLVPAEEFLPPPKVESAVMVLRPLQSPLIRSVGHRKQVYRVLDKLFLYRRKTLSNILMQSGLVQHRQQGLDALQRAGIIPERRPETLNLEEVLKLVDTLAEGTTAAG